MSRIGKKPVTWSEGTKVSMIDSTLVAESAQGSLRQEIDSRIQVDVDEASRTAVFSRSDDARQSRAMHGLYRALLANMIEGLEKGFSRKLEVHGVGYNARIEGQELVLNIGFNAPVRLAIPEGLRCEAPEPTRIVVQGIDKQAVGQFAANIRAVRRPEPYKGKGIRYEGEHVRRKVGKALGA